MKNPYIPEKVKILRAEKQTYDASLLTLRYRTDYSPGQFLEVSVLNIGEAPISICSYSKQYTEILVRAVGNVTHHICSLKERDSLFIRGPYGKGYPMDKLKDRNIVIIAGGTGIAPLRSVIKYIEQNRNNFYDISIFLGFRTPREILFKRDLKLWEKLFNLSISIDKPCKEWRKNVGFVHTIVDQFNFERDTVALICGPPLMMKAVTEILKKKNFKDENIFMSYERLMHCGIGKCGHCMINDKYVCRDGPVFNYKEAKYLED